MEGAESSKELLVEGCQLHVTTTLGDAFEGVVLTHDQGAGIVVIQEGSSSGGRRNLRFLKTTFIKDVKLIGHVQEALDLKFVDPDIKSLREREEAAIKQAEAEAERIGVGVTAEAQDIFDALSKTLPCRWDKTTILVMNDVCVNHPYLPENVIGGASAANERVRKVVISSKRKGRGYKVEELHCDIMLLW